MVPALVLAEQLVAGRPLHLRWSGALRSTSGPAPTASSARADRPGAQGRPERLVTCGGGVRAQPQPGAPGSPGSPRRTDPADQVPGRRRGDRGADPPGSTSALKPADSGSPSSSVSRTASTRAGCLAGCPALTTSIVVLVTLRQGCGQDCTSRGPIIGSQQLR